MDIVAFYKYWVRPDEDAGGLRYALLLQMMAKLHRVDLHMPGVNAEELARSHRTPVLRQYFNGKIIADRWRGVEAALSERPYALCWIPFWHEAEGIIPAARKILPWAPTVVDTVDVHFVREESAARLGLVPHDTVAVSKAREIATYQAADAVVVVTEEDASILKSVGVKTPIHVIPLVVPTRPRQNMKREQELLFVGGFRHLPNADGIRWFARECWPRVREKAPDAKLTVVGSNPTAEVLALNEVPGIKVVGYVAEVEPYLERSAVSIAPLRYGGGLKGKVCEAMAAGLPVVTTTFGAQGLYARDGQEMRVQDTAEGFSDAVVWALMNVEAAETMGTRGRKLIESICSPDAIATKTLQLIESLGKQPTAAQLSGWAAHKRTLKALTAIYDTAERFALLRIYRLFKTSIL